MAKLKDAIIGGEFKQFNDKEVEALEKYIKSDDLSDCCGAKIVNGFCNDCYEGVK